MFTRAKLGRTFQLNVDGKVLESTQLHKKELLAYSQPLN